MAFNKIILMGRITHDLELRTTPSGVNVCSFSIAVDRRFQAKGEERKSDYFNIVTWRQQAEFVTRYFAKGRMILVEGELQTRKYTDKNGNPATWYEVVADQVCFTGEKASNGGNTYGGTPSYGDPPPERGSYSAPMPPSSSGSSAGAPAPSAPPADFSSADDDDYPF